MMATLKFIIALIIILVITDFGVRNMDTVLIQYRFGFEWKVPLFPVMLIAIFIGFMVAWTVEHFHSLKIKCEAKRINKINQELEAKLVSFREKELLEPELEEPEEDLEEPDVKSGEIMEN
jgi:uncharacterized integral membrane protein